jgi:hypothetical protein
MGYTYAICTLCKEDGAATKYAKDIAEKDKLPVLPDLGEGAIITATTPAKGHTLVVKPSVTPTWTPKDPADPYNVLPADVVAQLPITAVHVLIQLLKPQLHIIPQRDKMMITINMKK